MESAFGFIMLGVAAVIVLGWLVPLIAGVCRWRRGAGGRVLTGIGVGWCLLIASLLGSALWRYHTWRQKHGVTTFDAAAYSGEFGTLVIPYDGKGSLQFEQDLTNGTTKSWNVAVADRKVRVPAGSLAADYLSLEVSDSKGETCGNLTVSYASTNRAVRIEPNGQQTLAGGFPLTASIAASRSNEQLSLRLTVVDTAGNDAMWRTASGKGSKAPSFEAVSSSGECFWRDNFEYG